MKLKNKLAQLKELRHRVSYATVFKLKTYIRRKLNTKLGFSRPSSYPYITGDGFRSIAQHIFDEISDIHTTEVAQGDIVFVRSDMLHSFFKYIHPQIQFPYILISHNSDQNITTNFAKYIDEKIIHWFAQNALIEHTKVTPLPIGLQLRMYNKKNKVIELLEEFRNIPRETAPTKSARIFYSFSEETNPKRTEALRFLKSNDISSGSEVLLERKHYYSNLHSHMYSASPEGNGIDCHRTWESMLLGSVPIVESNVSTRYWYTIGLPILLIDSWKDIKTMNTDSLIQGYKNLQERFDSPALYMRYWIDEIMKYKHAK